MPSAPSPGPLSVQAASIARCTLASKAGDPGPRAAEVLRTMASAAALRSGTVPSAAVACSFSTVSIISMQAAPWPWLLTNLWLASSSSSTSSPWLERWKSAARAVAYPWLLSIKPATTAVAPSTSAILVLSRKLPSSSKLVKPSPLRAPAGPEPGASPSRAPLMFSHIESTIPSTELARPSSALPQAGSRKSHRGSQHALIEPMARGISFAHPQAACLLAQAARHSRGSAKQSAHSVGHSWEV
mmetsp:Transcript_87762/g.204243  ORF Transcript_87762/g.204243 Transcript_87762/m.204243 type:complete len:243 (-) Transcript_87762:237-965(-)